ncbi:MAG: tetratricopeptide repeat protein, partial [Planctomycetota bacterium]
YMPPEQALGQVDQLDERADVFALGAVLCEILTGQPPYMGDAGDMLVMAAQGKLDDAFARLDECGADPVLIELAKDCLASVPGDRPARAGVVAERLTSHFAGLEERARRAKLEAAEAHAAAQEQRARLAAERLEAEKERAKATEERIKGERAQAAAEEQRRLSRWERHRQRRTIVLAALVLAALVIGGGSYVMITATKQEYSAEQHTAFSKAFAAATELAAAQRWSEAAASAEGTLTLLGPGQDEKRSFVSDAIRTWRAKQEANEAAAAREAKDRRVLERLRELRSGTAIEYDPVATDDAYAATFRDYGIDVERLKPEPAGRAIRAAKNPVELAAALDAWVALRRGNRALKNLDWRKLMSIAQVADPDPIRARIRKELVTGGSVALAHMASSNEIDSQPAQTLNQLAMALLTMGDAAGAARLFRRARDRYPADVWVNLGLATALSGLRPPRPAEAARYLRAALAAQPQSDQIRWRLGFTLAEAREWGAAAEIWRTLIRKSPDAPAFHGYLAGALGRLGDLDGARSAAERALELEPEAWRSWSALLDVLAVRADREGYLARCAEAKDLFPEDATILAHHARALARNGKHALALAAAGEALKRDAGNALACVVMGSLLLERGKADRAVGILQNGVDAANRMYGFNSEAQMAVMLERTFARALVATGELDQSEPTLVRRTLSNPRDVGALWGVAGVRRLQRHFPDELRVRRRIAQLDPHEAEAHREIGDVLRDRLGRYDEAAASYRRALALRPETGRYHSALARALALQGKTEEALRACRRAGELDPFDFGIRADLVTVLVQAGRMDEARRAAREAADAAPDLCAAQVAVGAAQLEVGDLKGATASFERAARLGPQSGAAQLLLGRARWRRADLAGAAAILRTAVDQRPRDAQAWFDLATVRAAQGEEEEALRGYRRIQSVARSFAKGYSGEAWLRGRAPEGDLRQPAEVVRLARRSVDLDPRDGAGWRALALGHLLSGDARAAGKACARALERGLDNGTAAEVLFLRAMAEAGQGRAADARRSYEAGLARMKVADGPSRDRDGLREEAAKLVGVEED